MRFQIGMILFLQSFASFTDNFELHVYERRTEKKSNICPEILNYFFWKEVLSLNLKTMNIIEAF